MLNNKKHAKMKHLFKETLNEKVFVEFYAETEKEEVYYCVSALFRLTHKSLTSKFKDYKEARDLYEYVIK